MSVPTLIVPVLNGYDLLEKLLASVDWPVDRTIIIDNGDAVPRWRVSQLNGTESGVRPGDSYQSHYRVIQPGHNLGVAASWNLGIKASPNASWWLIVNHDIEFGPGDLERLESVVEPRSAALYYMLGMAAFAVTPPAIRAVGFWDENIHPAYDEDLDWERRATFAGIVRVEAGFTGKHVGSATIYADENLRRQNGHTHSLNDRYYAQKWGGPKDGGEKFTTPFDRGGDVGDWTLDINRLRDQAWKP